MNDWEERVAAARARGGRVIAPNNLPITCIRADGTLLEHEHADHPDYKWPVEVEFVGEIPPIPEDWCDMHDEWRAGFDPESQALIYSDGYIAVTLYESCYIMWVLASGKGCGMLARPNWKLSKESRDKIASLRNEDVEAP